MTAIGPRPRELLILALVLILTNLCLGCSRRPAASTSIESAPSPVMAVSAARAVTAPIRSRLSLLGVTAALRHVALRAPCAGVVTGFDLQSGDTVRRGQVVARVINQEDLAAQSGLDVARQLDPHDSASLGNAVRNYASKSGVPVVAPQNAVLARRLVSSGQTVAYLDPLADLIDPASAYVEASVPIAVASELKPGMPVEISSPIAPGTNFPGRVAALEPNSGVNSATSAARIEFDGVPPIRIAGVAVEVSVITRYEPNALVIPQDALFEDASDRSDYVFMVDQRNIAHRTTVIPGIREDAVVQIVSGLAPGDIVVTSGGYALSDGLKVQSTILPFPLPAGPEIKLNRGGSQGEVQR